ncbi:MAG: hypothetical protein LBI54_04810 [Lachnospiraceae bacterium]|jgi:hypothetical protein|nr:hypothetical protein [Lachnospiraceae bacterium]
MKIIASPITIIKDNKKAYIVSNIAFYGLFVIAAAVTFFFPELQENAIAGVNQDLTAYDEAGLTVASAYDNANVPAAVGLTFIINLAVGAFLTMTLPSLIIPFSGLLMGAYRAIFWGILFAPISSDSLAILPHYLTLIIEGQANVFCVFAIILHGKAFLFPKSSGAKTRRQGYKLGLKQTAWLYIPIIVFLLIGAIYEALEVIFLIGQ